MLKIEIRTPGKVLQLPHNGEVVRTPYKFNVLEDSYKSEFEGTFKVKGIDDYTIKTVVSNEDIVEKVIPKMIDKVKVKTSEKEDEDEDIKN